MKTFRALVAVLLLAPVLAVSPASAASDCFTGDDRTDAILLFIERYYEWTFLTTHGYDDDPAKYLIEFDLDDSKVECTGLVRVEADCEITDAEGTPLTSARARAEAITCEKR